SIVINRDGSKPWSYGSSGQNAIRVSLSMRPTNAPVPRNTHLIGGNVARECASANGYRSLADERRNLGTGCRFDRRQRRAEGSAAEQQRVEPGAPRSIGAPCCELDFMVGFHHCDTTLAPTTMFVQTNNLHDCGTDRAARVRNAVRGVTPGWNTRVPPTDHIVKSNTMMRSKVARTLAAAIWCCGCGW